MMKDYHFPAAVTIPVAIGLVGVLWLLRRKSNSNEEKKRNVNAVSKEKEWTRNAEQQIEHIETEGITISQRKIPEILARDRGSSDLSSKEPNDGADEISQLRPVLEKLDVGLDKNIHFGQEIVEGDLIQYCESVIVQSTDITFCGESGIFGSAEVTPCSESGIFGSADVTPCSESGIFGSADVTPCSESCIFGSADVTPCGESGIFGSADATTCGESGILESGDITSCVESSIAEDGLDGCQTPVTTQDSQDGCQTPVIPQAMHDGCHTPITTQDTQDSCQPPIATSDTQDSCQTPVATPDTQDGCDTPVTTLNMQNSCQTPVASLETQASCQTPVATLDMQDSCQTPVATSDTQDSCQTPVATPDTQDSCQTPVATPDTQNSCQTPVATPDAQNSCQTPVATPDTQQNGCQTPIATPDTQDSCQTPIATPDTQDSCQTPVATPDTQDNYQKSAATLDTQDSCQMPVATPDTQDGCQTPAATQDSHSDCQTPVTTQDSHSDCQTPVTTQDSHSDCQTPVTTQDSHSNCQTPVTTQDSHSDWQTPVATQDGCERPVISQVCQFGTLKSINDDHVDDHDLSSSQREYLEQQIITAMENGMKEAQYISKSFLHVLSDSEAHDHAPRTDPFVDLNAAEEVLTHKIATIELDTSVDSDQSHEVDLTDKTPTVSLPSDGAARDIESLPLLKDIDVICATDTSSAKNKIGNFAAMQELAELSPQEGSNSSSLLLLNLSSIADFQPQIDIFNQAGNESSTTMTFKESDEDSRSHIVGNSLFEASSGAGPDSSSFGATDSSSFGATDGSSFGATDSSSFGATDSSSFKLTESIATRINRASISSIKSLSSERDESRSSSGRWMPKASSSSIDSFGPEEIEAIWGLGSSMDYLDKELFFLDTDPVMLPLKTDGLLNQATNMGIKQEDEQALLPLLQVGDMARVTDSFRDMNFQNCSTTPQPFPDKSLSADSLAKSISPMGDNNSEGSNDSGRGGSEHDVLFTGSDALVHFDFNMPSQICGQFIGKHGKNINYLKSRTGAHVTLTNSFVTPGFQVCQVSGTQAEVDDALSMIRRKFPLQDYPLLTMVPINMSSPVPVMSDNQIVFPEVMQLSLPEGVSVDVFVSAIVDAGQVFVQQPTHRSFMSLEKLNYFLNLVYTQDPNVPSVPLPIESGVICVCESEGFWYRAMIMSPEDENGDVQVKFVDYGGYVTVQVSALKQIRADFMNLPFQAVECFMANITPNQSEKLFSSEATQALSDMTQGKLLQCQVVARTEFGVPYIHLYQINSESRSAVLINQALVNSRLVSWIEIL